MLAALRAYTRSGGRVLYLCGNGLYWVTSLDAERPCGVVQRFGMRLTRLRRISQRHHPARVRYRFDQDILPLAVKLGREQANSRDIPPRPAERGHQSGRHHVFSCADDRY